VGTRTTAVDNKRFDGLIVPSNPRFHHTLPHCTWHMLRLRQQPRWHSQYPFFPAEFLGIGVPCGIIAPIVVSFVFWEVYMFLDTGIASFMFFWEWRRRLNLRPACWKEPCPAGDANIIETKTKSVDSKRFGGVYLCKPRLHHIVGWGLACRWKAYALEIWGQILSINELLF